MSLIWMVRAGRNVRYLDHFLENGCVTIGLSKLLGAEVLTMNRKDLVRAVCKAHPDWSKYKASNQAGQLFRFLQELNVGDEVVTYDPGQRRYILGKVKGKGACSQNDRYERKVVWTHRASRDALSVTTRNSLGAIQTIFTLNAEASTEIRKRRVAIDAPEDPVQEQGPEEVENDVADIVAENFEKSLSFIEDMIAGLGPYQMQDLVAGILRAMGYKTRVSPKGADRGVDIFASPDGLGLEEPRIFVEVKHRKGSSMGSNEVRSFMGGRQQGDRCLFVSTGGFTREAKYEADRSNVPLTLIDLPQLRELLIEHYDQLDITTKRMVPLVRMYWPAMND